MCLLDSSVGFHSIVGLVNNQFESLSWIYCVDDDLQSHQIVWLVINEQDAFSPLGYLIYLKSKCLSLVLILCHSNNFLKI